MNDIDRYHKCFFLNLRFRVYANAGVFCDGIQCQRLKASPARGGVICYANDGGVAEEELSNFIDKIDIFGTFAYEFKLLHKK